MNVTNERFPQVEKKTLTGVRGEKEREKIMFVDNSIASGIIHVYFSFLDCSNFETPTVDECVGGK